MSSTPAVAAGRRAAGRAGAALTVASGAAFLSMLDATVANLAVTDLRVDFPTASVAHLAWVITIYAVAFAALLAPGGRLADAVGRRALLVAGIAVFTIMSLACAAAPTLGILLVARGLQGAGAAAMIPASLAVVLADTPVERRAVAIGAWSAAGAFAAAAGPALGGVLVDVAGWRSVFFINVPIGLVLLASTQLLPVAPPRPAGVRLPDAVGTIVLGGSVGLAALGLSQAADWGWGDARTLVAIAAGLAGIAMVVRRSARHPAPALEISLWRSRTFALANLASLLYGACLFPWLLTGVLLLTQAWGYSPLQAGFAVTPGAVVAAVVALRAGPLVARIGPRLVVAGGALAIAAVALWMNLAVGDRPAFLSVWLPAGILLGAGMGAITTGLSSAAALSVPPARFAAGVGLNQTARQVGGALGVAGMATVLAGGDPTSTGRYLDVLAGCGVVTLAAALVALGLVLRPTGATA